MLHLEYFSKNDSFGWPVGKGNGIEYVDSRKLTAQMVEGFRLLKNNYDTFKSFTEQECKRVDKVFEVFSKYLGDICLLQVYIDN